MADEADEAPIARNGADVNLTCKNTFFHLPGAEDLERLPDGPATCPPATEGWWTSAPKANVAPDPTLETQRPLFDETIFAKTTEDLGSVAPSPAAVFDVGPTPNVWDGPRGTTMPNLHTTPSASPQPSTAIGPTPDWSAGPAQSFAAASSSPSAERSDAAPTIGSTPDWFGYSSPAQSGIVGRSTAASSKPSMGQKPSAGGGLGGFNKLLMEAVNMEEDSDEEARSSEDEKRNTVPGTATGSPNPLVLGISPNPSTALCTPQATPPPPLQPPPAPPPQIHVASSQPMAGMPLSTAPLSTTPMVTQPTLSTQPQATGSVPLPRQSQHLTATVPPRIQTPLLGTQPPVQGYMPASFAEPSVSFGMGLATAAAAHLPSHLMSSGSSASNSPQHRDRTGWNQMPPKLEPGQMPQVNQRGLYYDSRVIVDLTTELGSYGGYGRPLGQARAAVQLEATPAAIKARRRRGCKEARDPDRGQDNLWWLPTLAVVDLGHLAKVQNTSPKAASVPSPTPVSEAAASGS